MRVMHRRRAALCSAAVISVMLLLLVCVHLMNRDKESKIRDQYISIVVGCYLNDAEASLKVPRGLFILSETESFERLCEDKSGSADYLFAYYPIDSYYIVLHYNPHTELVVGKHLLRVNPEFRWSGMKLPF